MLKKILLACFIVTMAASCNREGKPEKSDAPAKDTSAAQLSDSVIHDIFNNRITPGFNETPASAQHVLENAILARFGKTGMADIKTIYMEVRIKGGDMGADSRVWMKMPDKLRTESTFGDKKGIAVYSQNNSWLKSPDSDSILSPSREEVMQMKIAAVSQIEYILSPISTLMKKPYSIDLVGKEMVDGKEQYVIKFSNPEAKKQKAEAFDEHIVYIDAKTFLDSKIVTSVFIKGKTQIAITQLSDNRKANGYMIAHRSITSQQNMKVVTEVKSLKLNEPIDDALFTKSSIK